MSPILTPLASTIVDQLPALLERLREHEAANDALTIECRGLEEQIYCAKKSVEEERIKQREIRKRIADKKSGVERKKRPRSDDVEVQRIVRPRLSRDAAQKAKRATSKDSISSIVSVRTKRRGRLFSEDEATAIMTKRTGCDDEP